MIKGPWPMNADETSYMIPLEGPHLTPMYKDDRVALRVSTEDHTRALAHRGRGVRGIVTDLDTGRRYRYEGRSCAVPHCYCDAEIFDEDG